MPKKQNKGLAQAKAVRATNMAKKSHTMPNGTKMTGKTHSKSSKKKKK